MPDRQSLHTLVFNSLEEQIAVIDSAGVIVDTNLAWTRFGIENGVSSEIAWAGSSYLQAVSAAAATGDSPAAEAEQGILDTLSGKHTAFRLEYPCHSPTEKRWFMMRIASLQGDARNLFVVSHHNITQRKLAEQQVEYLSLHDPLTGLANRRFFDQFLNNEMRRSTRGHSAISLIAFDVDDLKNYNDELGHGAGDQCLVQVGQALLAFSRRPSDLAARLGGDEFALLLGETGLADARKVADAIRQAVIELKMVFGGSRQVTLSAGVASVIPHQHQEGQVLLQEADKALYEAKLARRDRAPRAASRR